MTDTVAGLAALTVTPVRDELPPLSGSAARIHLTGSKLVIENAFVRRILEKENDVWRTRTFARADGTDELQAESDEFMLLLMDGTRLRLYDYQVEGEPTITKNGKETIVRIVYAPRRKAVAGRPQSITVDYVLGETPYLRKVVTLAMKEGDAIALLKWSGSGPRRSVIGGDLDSQYLSETRGLSASSTLVGGQCLAAA